MAFLIPDKILTTPNGLTIKQKIIPDSLTAPKDVASWCRKGQKMKPCAKLNQGIGKPRGITIHNTGDLKTPSGTNAAELYSRATYNGNMAGVVVHFYVWDNEIWQLLREDERGWHAADGSTRRSPQKKGDALIGGNLDTIAIECIGNRPISEETTAKLTAYLCDKHGLNPDYDVYTHKYFYPPKQCPLYILPHWDTFKANVKKYYNNIHSQKKPTLTPTKLIKVQVICNKLNVRGGAGILYRINTIIKKGEVYEIKQTKNGWGQLENGKGWIFMNSAYVKKIN